jgi:hypothetical protein
MFECFGWDWIGDMEGYGVEEKQLLELIVVENE